MIRKMSFRLLLYASFIFTWGLSPLLSQEENKEVKIKIESIQGTMILKLYNETPLHRDNMVKLVKEGYFDGQLFHRVIKDFMIQGGDPHSVGAAQGQRLGTGGPGYKIPAEFTPKCFHKKGALAAAREGDRRNPEKLSSGSQFYIVQGRVFNSEMLKQMEADRPLPFSPEAVEAYTTVGGTPHLDGAYTVFGELIEGMDVLDRIASQAVDAYNRPLSDVVYTISLVE